MRYSQRLNRALRAIVPAATWFAAACSADSGVLYAMQALEQFYLLLARDTLGTVTQVSGLPTEIRPFVSRDSGYKFVTAILDSAVVALQAGGSAFSFSFAPGFTGSPGAV